MYVKSLVRETKYSEMQERLARIAYMEELYDRICEVLALSEKSTEQETKLQDMLNELTAYYESPDWMADFDADRAGKIPKDMKRGVLAEDTIWNLLCEVAK